MHHSRLCTIVIDCQVDELAPVTDFWSRALGKPIASVDQDGDGKYAELQTAPDEPIILLQKVDHASRVHLDIETDDLDAEVARLEQLGARCIAFVRGRWWVLEAPSGHRFCVVRRQREAFGPHLNRWE
ncbi:glyoxalase [Rhodanobacter sp. FW510-R12]|uniref:VOC family protein n=1 Tax=unclassified Rhodanobacter TaxID=2621553 RepID=UPI0007A9E3D9|nr:MULTISPECIES: VOC family protein [unclassified Rhodanobacter]KZC15617.1 glyoxalase [Rhodanobacter sp. FW104-R8]KZC26198.1 glyoxalase [Rhodanobacter sp. FW510-T8]KZC32846.1 glyoxalase [Rhodanobacter sp. FW510-R10]